VAILAAFSFALAARKVFVSQEIPFTWRPSMSGFNCASRLAALFGALSILCASASAQTPEVVRVRGDIVSVEGSTLTVKSRQGADVAIHLADKLRLVGIVKASAADIKPGVFIGTSSVPKEGSTSRALEIHIFPEALRGSGEGDRAWDLAPGSSMTNGTAGTSVDSVDGKTITITYKGGQRTIVIQPDTVIVTYAAADTSDLKPGAKVFVTAQKAADGSLTASSVSIGKDGVTPPM
jgi:hypothetical protein